MAGVMRLVSTLCIASLVTSSSVWPLPSMQQTGPQSIALSCTTDNPFFRMHGQQPGALLQRAFLRYQALLVPAESCSTQRDVNRTALESVRVIISQTSELLQLNTTERYSMRIPACSGRSQPCHGQIEADNVFGVLRALESFSQLANSGTISSPLYIEDSPRFAWRGLMVDTARHFLGVDALEQTLSAMAICKLNVMHLHLTDAQSLPFASLALPSLNQGAFKVADGCRSPFNPLAGPSVSAGSCSYTAQQLRGLVSFARDRGIRLVAEVDTPAHSASFCTGYPEVCVSCNSSNTPAGKFQNGSFPDGSCVGESPPRQCHFGYFSLLDPSLPRTWQLLRQLLGELLSIFTDDFFHLGFDEVHYDCYNRPHINKWMSRVGITAGDYKGVVRWMLQKMQQIVKGLGSGRRAVVWQEASDHIGPMDYPPATPAPGELDLDTVVQLWYSPTWYDPPTGLAVGKTLAEIVPRNPAIVSFPWYLNANATLGPSFESLYLQDVVSNKTCTLKSTNALDCTCYGRSGDVETSCYEVHGQQLKNVLGGEAALWGESVDAENMGSSTFMAAAVVAERLWSRREVVNVSSARERIQQLQALLVARGLNAGGMPP